MDSYRFTARYLTPSYVVGRPILSRMPPEFVRWLAYRYVDVWWPFRRVLRYRPIRMFGWISPISPIFYYWQVSKNKSDDFLKEWAYLDTHDFISPTHDVPQTKASFEKLFAKAGMVDIEIDDLSRIRTSDGRRVSGFHAGRARAPTA